MNQSNRDYELKLYSEAAPLLEIYLNMYYIAPSLEEAKKQSLCLWFLNKTYLLLEKLKPGLQYKALLCLQSLEVVQ